MKNNYPTGRRIYVKVTPRAGRDKVEKISDIEYKVRVTVAPEKGKANVAVIELLAEYFCVAKNCVNIVGGKSTKTKIIDIEI